MMEAIAQHFIDHGFTVSPREPSHDGAIQHMVISKDNYHYHWAIARVELENVRFGVDFFTRKANYIMWNINQAIEKAEVTK